ncbi:protein kinase domain-containing protein [Streptomyces sp. WM6386]|uniref:protein kinase domain-containing protein n=1 Tax=Streptomyces sp. WM6386 TaxID=1415558 RepID=UPI000619E0AE|nr:hypothetical protein [Streptomyces sp. WM6386]KKD06691.1 hypothetical protein TN53_17175 [Streptomyces sp. WM6386]
MITCGGRGAEKSIFEIDFDQGEKTRDGFRERRGVLVHGGGERVVQRIAYTDQARRELANAVRFADLLVRRLGVTSYPPELSRVIGHRPDGRAPFLVAVRRGRPLSELRDELPLPPGELWSAVDGIIAVLTKLNELRVVHRDIRPEALLWDGKSVQLTESGIAVHEGEDRGAAVGTDPWRSPEQTAALGKADCRDDVYPAGAVIFQLATGEDAAATPEMRGRVRLLDSSLRNLLEGVFTDSARHRISGFTLRTRWEGGSVKPETARPHTPVEVEMEARRRFHELRARQRAYRQRVLAPPPPPRVSRAPAHTYAGPATTRGATVTGVIVLVAVVAVVALVAALVW